MNCQRRTAWMLGLGIAILSLGSAIDAQKGNPPAPVAATALFRCPGELCPAADPTSMPPVLTDAVTGDQNEMVYGAADGSQIDSAGEFALFLKPTGAVSGSISPTARRRVRGAGGHSLPSPSTPRMLAFFTPT